MLITTFSASASFPRDKVESFATFLGWNNSMPQTANDYLITKLHNHLEEFVDPWYLKIAEKKREAIYQGMVSAMKQGLSVTSVESGEA